MGILQFFFPAEDEEQRIVEKLSRAFHAGNYSLAVVPPYPHGYAQVEGHLPWESSALLSVALAVCTLGVARAVFRSVAPHAGRAVGRHLNGEEWLKSKHAVDLDWQRFSDVVFFTCVHLTLTLYVLYALLPEVVGWIQEPIQWYAFLQPPLSRALHSYYLVQIAANLESALIMLHGVLVERRARDMSMVLHHTATLFVITLAQRMGFVRVGAAIAMLHDATDLPIDFLRIGQALQAFPLVAGSAASAVISWAVLRGYAFPRLMIWSALTQTGHMWAVHSYAPQSFITVGYVLVITPLIVLWLLSLQWLAQLGNKMHATLKPILTSAQMRVAMGAAAALIVAAAVGVENLTGGGAKPASMVEAAPVPPPSPPPPFQPFFTVDSFAPLRTPACGYYNVSEVMALKGTAHLHPTYPKACDHYELMGCVGFDGAVWTRWTSHNWQLPLVAVALYLAGIVTLQSVMTHRAPMKLPLLTAGWNFGLALFSLAGALVTVPELLLGSEGGLLTRGFYASVCMHSVSYGCGPVGIFVALFIYSKFFELFDTVLLILRKAPVIPLHWYHHASVLLYCWHSYAARIGTGLWYAAMNYCVHALMYFYFGLTQCGPGAKKLAKKFSMLITLLQLSQMVVGITVTVSSVVYHVHGATCYVPIANSIIGLGMYTSYFVLFFALFSARYLQKRDDKSRAQQSTASATKSATPPHKKPEEAFTGWAGKQEEIDMLLDSGNEAMGMVCVGETTAAVAPAPRVRSRLSDPIPKPPNTCEPRVDPKAPAWLRRIPYPRAALSSFIFNLAGVMMYVPAPQRDPMGGPASALVLALLLHTMGFLSLANWTTRTEWSRLADVSCMLVLKITFIALALGLEADGDAAFLNVVGGGAIMSVILIFGLRLADDGADKVMFPVIVVLLAAIFTNRSPVILERPEGILAFALGYVCKLADAKKVAPRFLYWTATFHFLVAYSMGLAGLQLRGVRGSDYVPHLF